MKIYATTNKGWQVRIMAVSENWAMVRRKGAMPFCEMVGELTFEGDDFIKLIELEIRTSARKRTAHPRPDNTEENTI